MPNINNFFQDQYPATDESQCIAVYIPLGDEFKWLLAGLLRLPSLPTSYQDPDSEQAQGLADIWRDAYDLTDWSGCMPSDPVAAGYFYGGPVSGADAPPDFRPIASDDLIAALTTPPPIGGTTRNTGAFKTLLAQAALATDIPAIIKGAASQTADLLQLVNSSNSVLNAFKPDGRVDFGNVNSGGRAMNVFRGSVGTGTVMVIQGNGITNGGGIISTQMSAMTGTVYAIYCNVDSSADGYFAIQQNGAGNSVFLHRVLGAGDAKSIYEKNGGTTWALGMDQSDTSKFKLSLHSNLGTNDRVVIDADGATQHNRVTAGTNAVADVMTFHHESSGTPAAGFGAAIVTNLESSTTANRRASIIETLWNTPTDAGAIPDLAISVYYNAGGTVTKREGIRFRGDSAALKWVIGGGTPTATETVTGSRGGNAALADLLTKLASKGIIVDGSS